MKNMYLKYFVAIKNRPEMVIIVPVPSHDSSISDEEYAKYRRDHEIIRIRDSITNGQSFRIENRIFNPEAIDYVIVNTME